MISYPKEIKFTTIGKPCYQQRHRTYTKGRNGKPLPFPRRVDPSAKDKEEFLIRAMSVTGRLKPIEGSVFILVDFYLPRPKSHYRTGKYAGQLKPRFEYANYTKKPDIDNLLKFVLDALNGEYFNDDAQVYGIMGRKHYAESGSEGKTEVHIFYES